MNATWIRNLLRALTWTMTIVLFVSGSLLIASCQDKQEISRARQPEVQRAPAAVPDTRTAADVAIVAAIDMMASESPAEETAGPEVPEEPEVPPDGRVETQEPVTAFNYEVEPGDNLWDISLQFYHTHVYWRLLAEWNGIEDAADLRPEQIIEIPPETAFPYRLYLVREGDNLIGISEMFYDSDDEWETLAEANELASANRIHAGMILKIPALETTASAPADSSLLASE